MADNLNWTITVEGEKLNANDAYEVFTFVQYPVGNIQVEFAVSSRVVTWGELSMETDVFIPTAIIYFIAFNRCTVFSSVTKRTFTCAFHAFAAIDYEVQRKPSMTHAVNHDIAVEGDFIDFGILVTDFFCCV
jgi:hypothetical protein